MTREEALKILDTIPTIGEQVDALEMAIKALEQQKTGKWLTLENGNPYWRRCSECDAHRRMIDYFEHYCPSCGCKMMQEE